MNLSDEQSIALIAAPKNASAIELAKNQEERLLMHSESILEKYSLPFWAFRNFTLWWQSLVTKEKHNKIEQLITTPLSTTSLTEEIFNQIGKFRDAQDRNITFDFTAPDFTNDFNDFLQRTNDDRFWRDTVLDALKTGINDVVVIDLPAVQTTLRPEPYQYLVSPSQMVDLVINKYSGNVEYFIYRQSQFKWDSALANLQLPSLSKLNVGQDIQKVIVIDDSFYRVMIRPSGDSGAYSQLSKVPHNLGFCPCIDFWQPSIQGTNGINKKGILTNLLSKLDKYLFYSALVDYMDVYGAFPIFVTYAMDEEQFDDKNKQVNFGNYFSPQVTSYLNNDKGEVKDPRTSYSWMGAPGSIIEYQQPADGQDVNFVKDSPHFINMPVDALKHVNDRCASLKAEINKYATGEDTEYMNEIAKNDNMTDASFSKQDSILSFVKRQMERIHVFSIKTRAILRYGAEYFNSCTVDYGSDYFLKDATKIVSEYDAAVKAGMSPEYCYQIMKEACQTRFKNNPEILARQRIIRDLIPYQDKTNADLVLLGISESDIENYVIRINSNSFINQFELEYGDIVKFGKNLEYSDKIYLIQNKLKGYGKEVSWKPAENQGLPRLVGGGN